MIFLRNKKILNLCLRWHILRSYYFIAEVTFNPDSKKQVHKAIFSRKRGKDSPVSFFNDAVVEQLTSLKHLGFHLDEN